MGLRVLNQERLLFQARIVFFDQREHSANLMKIAQAQFREE